MLLQVNWLQAGWLWISCGQIIAKGAHLFFSKTRLKVFVFEKSRRLTLNVWRAAGKLYFFQVGQGDYPNDHAFARFAKRQACVRLKGLSSTKEKIKSPVIGRAFPCPVGLSS
jgi:hypothetical protein